MSNNNYCHPVVLSVLESLFSKKDWKGLVDYLDGLTNRDFRMAGDIIGTRLLVQSDADVFWQVFRVLLAYQPKAFLVTMLKAAVQRKQQSDFTLMHDGFEAVAQYLVAQGTDIDRMKFVTYMLQIFAGEPQELTYMLHQLGIDDARVQVDYLLRVENMATYYLLFMAMRKLDHEKELLTRCCHFLIKKGTSLSYNLASVMKAYFDLPQVRGTFSLTLRPYQMGRMETSYENFKEILQSI